MALPEEAVVNRADTDNVTWHSLLSNNQYDQITTCVERAYAQAIKNNEIERAALLVAAKQLCDGCVQVQKESVFHQEALHHSEERRDALEIELEKVLEFVSLEPETAVVAPPASTIWQRMWSRLWHREKIVAPQPDVLQSAVLEPGNDTIMEETAVSPTFPTPLPSAEPTFGQAHNTTPQLTIYCLGTFRVYEDEHPVEEWPSRKGKAIFKYLLLHRQQRITKDVLMAQFWPEATADAARNNLNVAIYGLRQALRNGYPEFSHVLFHDDCYFLNPEMAIWVDVEQFELVCERAAQKMQQGDTAVALPDLHAAELLYQGELLAEDPYESWPVARRQQLQRQYMQLLTELCRHYFETEQNASCITFANKLLQVEPCHEVTHRLLMRAYARQRQGYLALRQYHQCVELLAEELAVPPAPATTKLYETIRSHEPI